MQSTPHLPGEKSGSCSGRDFCRYFCLSGLEKLASAGHVEVGCADGSRMVSGSRR
jgi:hypothetical protein